jgi:hypothetical protein
MVYDLRHRIYMINTSNTILIIFIQLTLPLNTYCKLNNKKKWYHHLALSLCILQYIKIKISKAGEITLQNSQQYICITVFNTLMKKEYKSFQNERKVSQEFSFF